MKNIYPTTPTQANYLILNLIEQIVTVAPKGTALGLSDVMSAMFNGYFIESGGAVTPAVEAFLRREIEDEQEREAGTRRAAKAITYGSYNLVEIMNKLRDMWRPPCPRSAQVSGTKWLNRLRTGNGRFTLQTGVVQTEPHPSR